MKTSLKIMLAVSLLSAGFVTKASAVDVYLTGSSAYRGAVTNAIGHLLNNPMAAYVGTSTAKGSVAGANQQLITGTLKAAAGSFPIGTTVYFHTSWSGSLAGISTLTFTGVNPALPFLDDNNTVSSMSVGSGAQGTTADGGNALGTSGFGTSTLAGGGSHAADGAFSDAYQASTPYQSPVLQEANGSHVIGIVPFVFVTGYDLANSGKTILGPAATANTSAGSISGAQAKQLYGAGLSLGELTGSDTDSANGDYIYPVGRNADSGTRLVTFAETGFNPINGTSAPQQYQVFTSGGNVVADLYNAETIFSGTAAAQYYASGASGYSSGGNEAGALEISGTTNAVDLGGNANPLYVMGSLGESDGNSATKLGCNYLAYNGVSYASYVFSGTSRSNSAFARSLIDEGIYTLWGYEHCYYKKSPNTPSDSPIIDALAGQVRTTDAPIAGEIITNMAVQRDYEGGPISYVGTGQSTK